MQIKYPLLGIVLLSGSVHTWAGSGLSFEHQQWELYCSNTNTCRAAGYNAEDGDQSPASILLTRYAGPNQAIKAEIALSNFEQRLPVSQSKNIHLYLNGKDLGAVALLGPDLPLMGKLSATQTQALLKNPTQQNQIIFKNQYHQWQVSDQGMAATLLKMDDFQKRIGTTGAIIKRGQQNESKVLAAQPMLNVHAVATAAAPYLTLKPSDKNYKAMQQKLIKNIGKDAECSGLYMENDFSPQPIDFYKLSNGKVLASTLCWRAAYNEGYGTWVLDENLQGIPKLVTESATDISSGQIMSMQKGRGIGDCIATSQWVWDGKSFVMVMDRWSGMCRGIELGGVWSLDLIESQVK